MKKGLRPRADPISPTRLCMKALPDEEGIETLWIWLATRDDPYEGTP